MPFLQNITFPIVCCNIEEPYRKKLTNYIKKSIVVEVNDRKIGIIGYVTPETTVSYQNRADFKRSCFLQRLM